jgi:AcrR family transcriptional regulator
MAGPVAGVNTVAYGSGMNDRTARLTRTDWVKAGFRALVRGGPGALRIEAVARDLGASKGSFYWHFADLADWQAAMLGHWEEEGFRAVAAALDALPEGRARLEALCRLVGAEDADVGGLAAEPALRDWARWHAGAAASVQRVDAQRLAYVEACLAAEGRPDPDLARLFYAAFLGLQVLALSDGRPGERALGRVLGLIGRG